jgi:hypothetical protein
MADLVTLAEAKAHLDIPEQDTDDEAEISAFIASLTEPIERHVGAVLPVAYTERHDGARPAIALDHPPVVSITSVTLPGGVNLAAPAWEIDKPSGVLTRMIGDYPSCWEYGRITVVYTAGLATVPAHVRQAALIILQHLWETQRGSMQQPVNADDSYDPRWAYSIPRRALELLGPAVGGIA